MSKRLVSAAICFALVFDCLGAWGPTGHMIIAQIAFERLDDRAKAEATRLIGILSGFEPRTAHFVPASMWMDDIRHRGFSFFDRWHYINIPINADGSSAVRRPHDDNVVFAIEKAMATLKSVNAGDLQRALALRVLLHLVGDVHQPLHCVQRFSPRHPEGDRGGNDFEIRDPAGRLHIFWDETAGLFPFVDHNDEAFSLARIPEYARRVTQAFPPERFPEISFADPGAWAREGHRLAVDVVYQGIREGDRPSRFYRRKAQQTVQRRLALAGYRLASLLSDVLGEN